MSEPRMAELLAKAQELQSKLAALQQELARRTVEASAGGGLVTAVASGELRILTLRIDPELIRENDRAMLQDLCAAAVNAALAKAQRMVEEEMQRASGLPAGFPGLGGLTGSGR